ncbi:MBL fold metallo-hydrolase [Marinactinospora rubrisoli]|uniref:MBL fold metallo-hydrolase n=1 Tax=Marinactinospora rubrisoli TaxID=2715399 RepID=A0ABW2KJD3_9ACTN
MVTEPAGSGRGEAAGAGGLCLTVLGSASPYPRPGNPCSGYLVTAGDTRLWLDAGSGTLAALQRYCGLAELTGIWLSHLHADHAADLLTAFYALAFADVRRDAPVPLYAPPGIGERLRHFLSNSGIARLEAAFELHELYDGHRARLGALTLDSGAVRHGMDAYAVRVSDGRAALTYSGDTGPCDELVDLARGTDLLLCEADSDGPPEGEPAVHLTPEQAGATAARAGARRLVITHVGPFQTPEDACRRASAVFRGPVEYAAPGRRFTVAGDAVARS